MNYIFIRPNSTYDILYRHDVYGVSNPSFRVAYNWINKGRNMIERFDWNTMLTIL
jgi:hypothetical protein